MRNVKRRPDVRRPHVFTAVPGAGPAGFVAFGFVLATALLAACGSDTPSDPGGGSTDPDPVPGPNPDGVFECEIIGYPCSPSQVPMEILERSDALGDEALAMLDGGTSPAAVAAWLQEQDDITELQWNDLSIRFRVGGGRATWIFLDADDEVDDGPAAAMLAAAPAPAYEPASVASYVVDSGTDEKKALVLSPFRWEIGVHDDGALVATILAEARGYDHADGVTYLANNEPTTTTVSLDSFLGWEQYNVIHVATHGKIHCEDDGSGCRAVLAYGLLDGTEGTEPGSKLAKLKAIQQKGVETAKGQKGVVYLIVSVDFFRDHYGGGLDDVVIFINSCESFGNGPTDFVGVLQGGNSVFFGWDDFIRNSAAAAASAALYPLLADRGYAAEVAYEEMGDAKTGINKFGRTPVLRMSPRPGDGDVRIREVVYLLHPVTGEVLSEGDEVAIDGVMGDGEHDAVPFVVQVDGVRQADAGSMTVRVSIDGVESAPLPLTSGTKDDEDRWTIGGSVQLGYDLEEEKEVTFHAWVNLHSGGESQHVTPATLIGEPIMGWAWEFEAHYTHHVIRPTHTTAPVHADARLILRFDEDQDFTEPNPKYIVTAGVVSGDWSTTSATCVFTGATFTFTYDQVGPPRNHPSHTVLTFHTDADPVEYSAHIAINAPLEPEFPQTVDCGDGPEPSSFVPNATFIEVGPGEGRTVSDDRRSISGTWHVQSSLLGGGTFVRTTTYTITRIE